MMSLPERPTMDMRSSSLPLYAPPGEEVRTDASTDASADEVEEAEGPEDEDEKKVTAGNQENDCDDDDDDAAA